ncbi:DUF4412 domain-containing protein [Kordia algicida OT-1]|uniref:DUF4412 domain-containing protein n=1 Tax=Kordia algicida OT-1 TaxID=391587 RepID=A9E186_9FLAO|nr:DUF4412 domain-containing protein [Kordia algicida]EDP95596.1 hypothetical protein KAOT1_22131 [Kordia algicida OT-1]
MKSKLHVLLFIFCLGTFQHADAQLFKRLKKKAKEKVEKAENDIINKIDKKVDKTIDDAVEGKKDSETKNTKIKNTKDFGDIIIKHSKKFGSVEITEVSQINVSKTNSGYTMRGNWWSHEADIYDGFILTIKTDKNLKHDTEEAKNRGKQVFKIPQEATLKLGYDPQLPYNKKTENGFKRAVTDDYQNYEISKGEVAIDVLSDETIQISFSGKVTLREVIRKANTDDYSETFFEASVTGGIDSKTPKFINEETIVKNTNENSSKTTTKTSVPNYKTSNIASGSYHFTHETVTKITVSEQNRTYKMSYLINPNATYIGMKADMSEYSEGEMNGESIIVMDKGNTHIFVESAGMKMRMSGGMMGQKMENPTDKMANFDYTKLTKTGKTKTILGAECHEYTMSDSNAKMQLWVAPNINLPNWFIQNNEVIKGHIMEYSMQSNEGNMKSEIIEIKDHISKTINPKDYKKMF